jgi:hypothetical protein
VNREKMLPLVGGILILLILAMSCIPGANAQLAVTTATLSGTIADPTRAVIPKATVTLTSPERGIIRTFTTGDTGQYLFTQLPPSTYQLMIQAKGFEKYIQNGIILDAGQTSRQDVTLKVGDVAQQIVVNAEAPMLNLDDANISADIGSTQVVELPLNMRNVYGLATLNSSVGNASESQSLLGGGSNSNDNADQDISFFHFAGGFFGTSAFLLDGAWNTDTQWGAVIYVPSVDAVQEFKIQNNSFTSQYGWSTGNVIDVVTKSGTNAFHGDAYEFFRDGALDANLYFNDLNGLAKPSFSRNQVGISAGGPLVLPGLSSLRKNTYIFGLYEHFGVGTLSPGIFTVPDANMLAGNFGELLGPPEGTDNLGRVIYSGAIYNPSSIRQITQGQVDPVTGLTALATGWIRDPIPGNNLADLSGYSEDPVAKKVLSYYPAATNSQLANNFVATGVAPAASNEYLVRVDHNFSNASRLFGRYSYKQEYKTYVPRFWGASNPAGPGATAPNNRWNVAASFSHAFSQSFLMNTAFGVSHWVQGSLVQSAGFVPSSLGFPTYLDQYKEFPVVQFGDLSGTAGGTGSGANSYVTSGPVGSISVDFTKLAGRHTINFGFMGAELKAAQTQNFFTQIISGGSFTQGPDPFNVAANTGNGVAQAMLGLPDGGQAGIAYNATTQRHYLGWYIQDDWHVVPKLTMNLGFRYEIQGAPTVGDNMASAFNPNVVNPISTAVGQTYYGALQFLSSSNRGVYDTNYKNFAPRIGLTYQALPKLAIRAGYGIFYPQSISTPILGATTGDGFAPTTGVTASVDGGLHPVAGLSMANPWPGGYIPVTGNSLGELQDVGYGLGTNFRNRASSYVQQYMMGFQYALTPKDSLEADYVGNHGVHLMVGALNPSQLDPKYLPLGQSDLSGMVANPFYGNINFISGASPCGLDQPQVVYSQVLNPYPQYCGVGEIDPTAGWSNYNSLQVKYNHRFEGGLNVLVSYTYSKFLDVNEGNQTWAYQGNQGVANNYNLAAEKSVDAGDIPQTLVASYVYTLPIGRGKRIGGSFNRATDAVLGGWELSGITTFRGGLPLAISGNLYPTYGGNPRPDVIGDVHVAHPTINEWFNTAAFTYAQYGSFGDAPRYFSNLRGPGYQNWDLAIMKNWALFHETRLQFRAEMFNAFNHPQFYVPSGGYPGCDPNSNPACPPGFGQIFNTFPGREVQFGGKFYW